MRAKGLVFMGVVGVALLAARLGGAFTTFTDPTGDSGDAPDIASVVVSHDASGLITFRISIANQPELASDAWITVHLDTDQNPSTGQGTSGVDHLLQLLPPNNIFGSSGGFVLARWNGAAWEYTPSVAGSATYATGVLTFEANRTQLGGSSGFDFWVTANHGPAEHANVPGHFDTAPDFLPLWRYQLVTGTTPTRSTPDLGSQIVTGVVRIDVVTCHDKRSGSGLLVGPGLVATVEHVVDGAKTIILRRNGRRLGSATVIGRDRDRDLALLKAQPDLTGHQFVLGTRTPRLAESVVVVGYPAGLPLSVTRGTISGLNRTIRINGVRRRGLVQTDAAVNHGNSGGPLLSLETGEVLGLVDIGSTQLNGIAFAVSAKIARPLFSAWQAEPRSVAPVSCR